MAVLGRKKKGEEERVLDVQANMQGSLVFEEPVALRISGGFSGTLETQGDLTIGEKASVKADITGDAITIAGQVDGKVVARRSLKLIAPAVLTGQIQTPSLEVQFGASLNGEIRMDGGSRIKGMSSKEVSDYLEVELQLVEQWAQEGKLPGSLEGRQWQFEKNKIDEWVATQKSS